jgi:hypothetical protein
MQEAPPIIVRRIVMDVLSGTNDAVLTQTLFPEDPALRIDTAVVDSLKALEPNRPIREADIPCDCPALLVWPNLALLAD